MASCWLLSDLRLYYGFVVVAVVVVSTTRRLGSSHYHDFCVVSVCRIRRDPSVHRLLWQFSLCLCASSVHLLYYGFLPCSYADHMILRGLGFPFPHARYLVSAPFLSWGVMCSFLCVLLHLPGCGPTLCSASCPTIARLWRM